MESNISSRMEQVSFFSSLILTFIFKVKLLAFYLIWKYLVNGESKHCYSHQIGSHVFAIEWHNCECSTLWNRHTFSRSQNLKCERTHADIYTVHTCMRTYTYTFTAHTHTQQTLTRTLAHVCTLAHTHTHTHIRMHTHKTQIRTCSTHTDWHTHRCSHMRIKYVVKLD